MVLGLAMVCGVSAAVAVSQMKPEQVKVELETTAVVTAAIDIPRGTSVTADVLKMVEWPKGQLPEGAMLSIDDIVGRTAIIPMLQGEMVLERKVAEGLGVASLIGPGMRAFTISTPDMGSKVAGLLLPGNKVDVLWTQINNRDEFSGGASVATLLQRVEVFAIDQATEKLSGSRTDGKLQSVTLVVSEEQAKRLSLAQSQGALSLALRRDDDKADTTSPIITLNNLRGVQGGPPTQSGLATAAAFFKDWMAANQAAAEKAAAIAKEEELARKAELARAEAIAKEEEAKRLLPPEPVWVRIRTLRGRNSSQVNLQLHGQAKVTSGPNDSPAFMPADGSITMAH